MLSKYHLNPVIHITVMNTQFEKLMSYGRGGRGYGGGYNNSFAIAPSQNLLR
jgi:hypothetical protein